MNNSGIMNVSEKIIEHENVMEKIYNENDEKLESEPFT